MGSHIIFGEVDKLEWASDGKYMVIHWVDGRKCGYKKHIEKMKRKGKEAKSIERWVEEAFFETMGEAYEWYKNQFKPVGRF